MNTLTIQTCRKCGELQPIENFSTYDNGLGPKHRRTCRHCRNEYQSGIRANGGMAPPKPVVTEKPCVDCKRVLPIEGFRSTIGCDKKRRRESICRECRNRRTREWNAKYRDTKVLNRNLLKSFGITLEVYQAMNQAQGGLCAICGGPPEKTDHRNQRLAVDHCHKTGKVRALLCSTCNNGLGCFKDNQDNLQKAIEYLNKHSSDATSS